MRRSWTRTGSKRRHPSVSRCSMKPKASKRVESGESLAALRQPCAQLETKSAIKVSNTRMAARSASSCSLLRACESSADDDVEQTMALMRGQRSLLSINMTNTNPDLHSDTAGGSHRRWHA